MRATAAIQNSRVRLESERTEISRPFLSIVTAMPFDSGEHQRRAKTRPSNKLLKASRYGDFLRSQFHVRGKL
jgi:hypothetical protein